MPGYWHHIKHWQSNRMGLARLGAIVARDRVRGEAARDEIRNLSGNPNVDVLLADLSSKVAIRQLMGDCKVQYAQLHVLVNNAGVAPIKHTVADDGFETTFAVNYLAPFLLTNLLINTLKDSAPARLVNVAGDFRQKASIHLDDLRSEKEYGVFQASNQSKLALILFTYELARRLTGTNVTVNCFHPGAVETDPPLKDPDLSSFSRMMYQLVRLFFLSLEKGAETYVCLASSPDGEGISVKYFIKKSVVASSLECYNEEITRNLWEVSAKLTGVEQNNL